MVPQVPVLNTQIRQELYAILVLLCKYDENYSKMVSFLEDLIPQGLECPRSLYLPPSILTVFLLSPQIILIPQTGDLSVKK